MEQNYREQINSIFFLKIKIAQIFCDKMKMVEDSHYRIHLIQTYN